MEKKRNSKLDTAMDLDLSGIKAQYATEEDSSGELKEFNSFDMWEGKKAVIKDMQVTPRLFEPMCCDSPSEKTEDTKTNNNATTNRSLCKGNETIVCKKSDIASLVETAAADPNSTNGFAGMVKGLKEINTGLESLDKRVEELMEERKKSFESSLEDDEMWRRIMDDDILYEIKNVLTHNSDEDEDVDDEDDTMTQEQNEWAVNLNSPDGYSHVRQRDMSYPDLNAGKAKSVNGDRPTSMMGYNDPMCQGDSYFDPGMLPYIEQRNASFDSYETAQKCYMWGWFCRKCGARDLRDCQCNNNERADACSRASSRTGYPPSYTNSREPIVDLPRSSIRNRRQNYSLKTITKSVISASGTIIKSAWTWVAVVAVFAAKEYLFRGSDNARRSRGGGGYGTEPRFNQKFYNNMIDGFQLASSSDEESDWEDMQQHRHLFRPMGDCADTFMG